MENKEIKAWIDGERDYSQGRMLFDKYSNKTPMKKLFARKYKPLILEYQLHKLLKVPFLENVEIVYGLIKGKPNKPVKVNIEKINNIQIKKTVINPETVELAVGRKQVVIEGKVRYEDLPGNLKAIYGQNQALYKQMRAIHEKMKLAPTDEARKKLRKELADYDDQVAGNWKLIDAWDGTVKEEVDSTEEEKEKQLAAARKYLSVNMKAAKTMEDGLKRQNLLFKIKERADILQANGVISGIMAKELHQLGIDI